MFSSGEALIKQTRGDSCTRAPQLDDGMDQLFRPTKAGTSVPRYLEPDIVNLMRV